MKRTSYIDYPGRIAGYESPRARRTTRRASSHASIVGVICDNPAGTVLELEVRADGWWSLVERPYGVTLGTERASGNVNEPWPECDGGCDLRPGRGGHDDNCPSVTGETDDD